MIIWEKIEKLAKSNLASLMYNSEYNFNVQVAKVADDIFNNSNCKMVMLAGPSASGKTTFANLLANRLEFLGVKVHRISTDDFFIDREKIPFLPSGVRDFDSPAAMDMEFLKFTLGEILDGRSAVIPHFDFVKGVRDGETTEIRPGDHDITIVEGIHALNPVLLGNRTIGDEIIGVFIAPKDDFILPSGRTIVPDELRLLRRLVRDYYSRGYTVDDTLRQWQEVLNSEKQYIYPYVERAKHTINSVYGYELLIYKRCLDDALAPVDNKWVNELKIDLQEVSKIEKIEIPKNSLLNEFIIGGVIK